MDGIMTENPCYTRLENRGILHIEGPDRHDFLQNLVTNDIGQIRSGACVYACLLNAQGKFLHDFFVSAGDSFFLLECEGGERAQDLYKLLNLYRLRADVKISVEENVQVYAIFSTRNVGAYGDPRNPELGFRSFEKPDLEEKPFSFWDQKRIRLCIPDGSRDLLPGNSTLHEGRLDELNGISYEKGCYVGQELTARMHYRGLAKKHLYAIEGNLPEFGAEIRTGDTLIGEMRSSSGNIGLALLKDTEIEKLKIGPMKIIA
jgi:tRNA-modifying protein YgfZ